MGSTAMQALTLLCQVSQAVLHANLASAMEQEEMTAAAQVLGLVSWLLAYGRHSPQAVGQGRFPLLPNPAFTRFFSSSPRALAGTPAWRDAVPALQPMGHQPEG